MEQLLSLFNEFAVAKGLAGLLALLLVGVCIQLTAREISNPV